jgi:hypothetical protein
MSANSRDTAIREASKSAAKASIADHPETAVVKENFIKTSDRSFSYCDFVGTSRGSQT